MLRLMFMDAIRKRCDPLDAIRKIQHYLITTMASELSTNDDNTNSSMIDDSEAIHLIMEENISNADEEEDIQLENLMDGNGLGLSTTSKDVTV